jgi:glycogen debranching enzyme
LQALAALNDWAQALGMAAESAYWSECRLRLAARFEDGWWLSDSGVYADSLQRDGTPQLDYHWTAIVPVQTGVALLERQQIVYAQVKEQLTNEWGLVHTGGVEQSVWTLPTGLLALAAFRQGDEAYAITLLKNIGVTARHGSIGLMKELIPEGLCFVQLWSAALYCQGIVEGVLGFRPDMPTRTISLTPNLESGAGPFRMEGLVCGDHTLDVRVHQTHIHVVHRTGSGPLHWRVADRIQGTTQAGESADFYGA